MAGPAVNGTDYGTKDGQPLSGSVVIPAGYTAVKLRIFTYADEVTEGTERMTLKLSASATGAYTLGSPAKVKLLIVDTQ